MSRQWRQRLSFVAVTLGAISVAACNKAPENDTVAARAERDTGAASDTGGGSGATSASRDTTGAQEPTASSGPTEGRSSNASPGTAATRTTGIANDTARGTVRRVGNEPRDALVLEQASGSTLTLDGPGAALLRAVEGLEVMVAGRLTNERITRASPRPIGGLEVDHFTVRAADGRQAHDGILVTRDGSWFLRMAKGGEQRIGAPPAALREHVGARVWIAGPLGGPPQTFGVIHR